MDRLDKLETGEKMDKIKHTNEDKLDNIDMESRLVWNHIDNTVDMGRLKATDLRENNRIILPQSLPPQRESILQARLTLWKEVFFGYMSQNC